ncbi:Hypp6400 [Branchiostoma lanceolatum]|uniref:Hypp6400 protein n=1 Tax=Branchiostoma lanceolatum TaxID=7740 RepID=A0A8J9YU12_BRALA|nr:Hypp6400 [Branchiostoma lanceolatum]
MLYSPLTYQRTEEQTRRVRSREEKTNIVGSRTAQKGLLSEVSSTALKGTTLEFLRVRQAVPETRQMT